MYRQRTAYKLQSFAPRCCKNASKHSSQTGQVFTKTYSTLQIGYLLNVDCDVTLHHVEQIIQG